jgi:hypothetical protein
VRGGRPRVVFLHVPKTGGTTFVQILERHFPARAVLHTNGVQLDTLRHRLDPVTPAQRAQVALLHGHVSYGAHTLFPGPAVYLTLLREPVDRFVSTYYFERESAAPLHEFLVRTNLSLAEFTVCDEARRYHDLQVRLLAGEAAPGEPEDLLARAKLHVEQHFKLVGLIERFDESVLLCGRRMGWRNLFSAKVNVTRERPRLAEVPAEVRAAIRARNALDVELYAWAQARFAAEVAAEGIGARELAAFRFLNRCYSKVRITAGDLTRPLRQRWAAWRRAPRGA